MTKVEPLEFDCIRCSDVVVQVSRINWFSKRAFVSFFFTKGPGPRNKLEFHKHTI